MICHPFAVHGSFLRDVIQSRAYQQELDARWEKVLDALASGEGPQIAVAAMTYCYYWYNFMPLARGTAASGYVTLLALFLAADMPITARIPQVRPGSCESLLGVRFQVAWRIKSWGAHKCALAGLPGGLGGHPQPESSRLHCFAVAVVSAA